MMNLVESRDTDLILSFMKGDGIVRRCLGGWSFPDLNLREFVEESPARFLVAYEGDKPWGFVTLNEEFPGAMSIHLCLKTIGGKTRVFFRLALDYAKNLGATVILAAYPESYRGTKKLLSEFGFYDAEPMFDAPCPYKFQRLSLV